MICASMSKHLIVTAPAHLVQDQNGQEKIDLEVKAEGDAVDDVGFHPCEDASGGLDGFVGR